MAESTGSEQTFTPKEQIELETVNKTFGINGCLAYYKRKMEEWKAVPLKVGIIGASGVGKSSCINALRGVKSNALEVAKEGVTEETSIVSEYPHPNNKMLIFCDLPGVGTKLFPQDRYLDEIKVDSYDCFVIITSSRFTEIDAWLAKEIGDRKKHFYFARSKIAYDVDNDKFQTLQNHNEKAVLDEIRSKTVAHLKTLGMEEKVFLIDNHLPLKYDFAELKHAIIDNLSELKRHAMVLTLSATTQSLIKVKAEELRKRVRWAALASAAVKIVPIPSVGIDFDAKQITLEIEFYYKQFGLDDDSLQQRAELMSVSFDSLKQIVKREVPQASGEDLLEELAKIGAYVGALEVSRVFNCILIIGALVTTPISLSFTTFALEYMLNKMEKASIEVAIHVVPVLEETCLTGN